MEYISNRQHITCTVSRDMLATTPGARQHNVCRRKHILLTLIQSYVNIS